MEAELIRTLVKVSERNQARFDEGWHHYGVIINYDGVISITLDIRCDPCSKVKLKHTLSIQDETGKFDVAAVMKFFDIVWSF